MGGGLIMITMPLAEMAKQKPCATDHCLYEFSISPCARRILKINNQLGAHGNNENFRVASSDVCLY